MTDPKPTRRLSIEVPQARYLRLKRLSTETHAPISLLANVALKRYLNGVIFNRKDTEGPLEELAE
jgi:hypothetical protein